MVQTCLHLFGHVCDWCVEDTAVHLQNLWDVGDPGVYLAALGSAQCLGK